MHQRPHKTSTFSQLHAEMFLLQTEHYLLKKVSKQYFKMQLIIYALFPQCVPQKRYWELQNVAKKMSCNVRHKYHDYDHQYQICGQLLWLIHFSHDISYKCSTRPLTRKHVTKGVSDQGFSEFWVFMQRDFNTYKINTKNYMLRYASPTTHNLFS